MRVVLDTNIVLSALLFSTGRLTWIREAWTQRTLVPLVSRETVNELIRVLAYPKFKLDRRQIEALLGEFLLYAEAVEMSGRYSSVPECKDPDDQKFLNLAGVGGAEALVTGDRDLLALAGQTPFEILEAAALQTYHSSP